MKWAAQTDQVRYSKQKWFAWHPVVVHNDWVWFEYVVRQLDERTEKWNYLYVLEKAESI